MTSYERLPIVPRVPAGSSVSHGDVSGWNVVARLAYPEEPIVAPVVTPIATVAVVSHISIRTDDGETIPFVTACKTEIDTLILQRGSRPLAPQRCRNAEVDLSWPIVFDRHLL